MSEIEYIMDGLRSKDREAVLKALNSIGQGAEDSPLVSLTILNKALLNTYFNYAGELKELKGQDVILARIKEEIENEAGSLHVHAKDLLKASEDIRKELNKFERKTKKNPVNTWLLLIGIGIGAGLALVLAWGLGLYDFQLSF